MKTDLNLYDNFVSSVTSDASKTLNTWIKQLQKLEQAGVNPSLLATAAIGLPDEAGEFSGLVKKLNFHGKELTDDVKLHLKKELGDVIFYWMMGVQALGLDPYEVIELNVKKLEARYPGGFSVMRSEKRAAGDV